MTRRRPETQIRLAIRNFFREVLGWSVWDMEQNRRTRQTPGFPDLVAIGEGRILFIECKTPGGKLSNPQKLFRDECLDAGGEWFMWTDVREAFDWAVENGLITEAA